MKNGIEKNKEENGVSSKITHPKNKKLIFAHAIWRHGKRNPMVLYRNTLIKEDDFVHGLGELIHEGMMEHYVLGKKFRERFIEETSLVSPNYIAKEIHVRSTYVNRAITSAQSHFLSFYSNSVAGKDYPLHEDWPQNFVPVPIHPSGPVDPVLLGTHCESVRNFIRNTVSKTPEFLAFVEKYKDFFKKIIEKSGHPEYSEALNGNWDSISKIFGVSDTITHEHLLDLPRASWVDELYQEASDFTDEYYANIYGFRGPPEVQLQARKIFGGPIIWEMIDRFRHVLGKDVDKIKLKGKIPKKYYVYSAHDTSIVQLFSGLGFKEIGFDTTKRPDTSDAVTVELWQGEDGSTVIKIFYFRKEYEEPTDMSRGVSGCEHTEEGCTLEEFIKRSEIYKPDDYGK